MYCNYSKDKFGNEVTFIIPCWMDKVEEGHYDLDYDVVGKDDKPVSRPYPEDARVVSFWYMRLNEDKSTHLTAEEPRDLCLGSLWECEDMYFKLLSSGWKPQQARAVLPNALKTELVMTGFADDWWGQYLVVNKKTGLIDKIIPGRLYDEVDKVDTNEYRIVEKGFFPLRCSKRAHPDAQYLANQLREEFIKKGIKYERIQSIICRFRRHSD